MITRHTLKDRSDARRNPGSVLLLAISWALIAFVGCSSSHTFTLDAPQPAYFGKWRTSSFQNDTTRVQAVKPILLATSHTLEQEKVVKNRSMTFTKEGFESTEGDPAVQVDTLLHGDSTLFIGDSRIHATIEAYIPLSVFLNDILASLFGGGGTSEGLGEGSSEEIEVSGTVFKVEEGGR